MADAEKDDAGPNRIMVFLRIRPAKTGEIVPGESDYLMEVQSDMKTVKLEGGKQYIFDWVFDGIVEQELLFKKIAVPVVRNVFTGFWGSMMCYGQTGTGKSFTMCNFDIKCQGIIPRTMRFMFDEIDEHSDRVFTIRFSFIQIYLDKLQDLFNPEGGELKITRDAKGVDFPGIVTHTVKDADDFRRLYDDGNQYRVITATKMNPESSRGHAALFIQVGSVPKDDPGGENRSGKLFLIDLAGYERFSKTGVQEGLMKEEAKTINASLLSLGNVVQCLAEKSEHIPWRNAKLTRMLEDAIGGKAKCSIILTAGPSNEHLHESLGTLYFGSRAMSVKTNAKLAVNVDYKKLAAKLQEMLAAAEGKISTLEVEATRRQLEREQAEGRMQGEWASIKRAQEDQLQKLLADGASPEKIQELIDSNKMENDLLEEQHYQERQVLEELHEKDIKEAMTREQQSMTAKTEASTSGMSLDVSKLQRELAHEKEEKEAYKQKAKDAEVEAKRLTMELTDAKIDREMDIPMTGAGGKPLNQSEIRKEVERRVEAVKAMLEDTHQLQLQEVEEPLREELNKYKELYEELKASFDDQMQMQKDALTSSYEDEIRNIRQTSQEVQEKLKKNHMTIKTSYQKQKQEVNDENEKLMQQVADLTRQLEQGGGSAQPSSPSQRPGVPSLAEVMIQKKQAEKKAEDLVQTIEDLKSEIEYAHTERDAVQAQLKEYEPKEGEERLKPAAIRKLKEDHEKMKAERTQMETELFKLKAAQALSGPQQMASGDESDDEEDTKEDLFGDLEGLQSFSGKLLRFPYFSGAQPIPNTYDQIAGTLQQDLDDYRRMLRYRFMFLGSTGSGKTSAVKCLTAVSAPMIKSLPEVQSPTIHPSIHQGTLDELYVSKTDWYKLYVQFQDINTDLKAGGGLLSGVGKAMGAVGSLVGIKEQQGVADPAKLYVEIVDFPGAAAFWKGMPSTLLPGKNCVYAIAYDLTQPVDVARSDIEQQLTIVHASAARNYQRTVGGDAPRVAVILIGTHRDGMRDKGDSAVTAHLNKVTLALGDAFYRIRGEDSYGLICIGNFATSAKDWSVISSKGNRGPQTFRDLYQYMGTIASQLYNNKPSNLLPTTKEGSVSHMTYMLGEDMMEGPVEQTSKLDKAQQRLRKGMVTFITGLQREQKVRWLLPEKELRALIAEHLTLEAESRGGISAMNYIVRELLVRGVIVALPAGTMEPKYLPKPKEDITPGAAVLPRDTVICLDPLRILMLYSLFMCPGTTAALPETSAVLKTKETTLFDYAAFAKLQPLYQKGFLTQDIGQVLFQRVLPITSNDLKLLFEIFSILGLGLTLRSEVAMITPAHFKNPMPAVIMEYLPYLVTNHGDGLGRKYKVSAAVSGWFARLQLKLIPFSVAPCKEPNHTEFNWSDASFLIMEKSRLKWGMMGSKVVKDAVCEVQLPLRGILKLEGEFLYVAISARGPNSAAMTAACKTVMSAIHYEITSLCKREYRGVKVAFQEMTIVGSETKRTKLPVGIETILTRFGAKEEEIAIQKGILGQMTDPKGQEIEAALLALPLYLKEE